MGVFTVFPGDHIQGSMSDELDNRKPLQFVANIVATPNRFCGDTSTDNFDINSTIASLPDEKAFIFHEIASGLLICCIRSNVCKIFNGF